MSSGIDAPALVLQASMLTPPCPWLNPAWQAFTLERISLKLLPSQATIISLCFPSLPSTLERALYAGHLHFLTTHSFSNPFQSGPRPDSSLIGRQPAPKCQTQQPLLRPLAVPAPVASDTSDHTSAALPDSKKEKRRLIAIPKTKWESITLMYVVPKKEGIQKETRLKPKCKPSGSHSQPGPIWPPKGHLAIPGNIFGFRSWEVLLGSNW